MQARQSDEQIFSKVYKKFYPLVYRIAYRISGSRVLAEDFCHEAFIKYYERAKPLPDFEQTKYWLIRVVKNIAFNYEKKKSREKKAYDRMHKYSPNIHESGETRLIREETKSAVQKALDQLPYKLKVAITLKEYGGLSYREIGRILGIREGNVKVRVFRARERLAQILGEESDRF